MSQIIPKMSVVLLTPEDYETIRRTICHLRAQTVRDCLEIVIVAPSAAALGLNLAELKDFLRVKVVEVGPLQSTAAARAAGIRRASAPVVALGEDHSFPAPYWAEALIAAHRQHWAAVGPVVDNANPESCISRANYLVEYAPWSEPAVSGVVDALPGHNSSYKRTLLLDYGPDLETMLEAESLLHQDLQARGYQIYLEAAAKTYHLNYSTTFSWIQAQFNGSRLFAAARSRYGRWSLIRRLLYGSAAPLIPLVRFRRILAKMLKKSKPDLQPGVFLWLSLVLFVSAAGEMLGYIGGAGRSNEKLIRLEFNRHLCLSERDIQMLDYLKDHHPVQMAP